MQTHHYMIVQQDTTHVPYFPTTTAGPFKYQIMADTEVYNSDLASNLTQADNGDAQVRRSYGKNGTLVIDSLRIRTVAPVDSGGNFTTHQYALRYQYDLNRRRVGLIHPPSVAPVGGGVWAAPGSVDTIFRCSDGMGGAGWGRDGGTIGSSR